MNRRYFCSLFCVLLFVMPVLAENASFTNLLAQGERAEKNGDVPRAAQFYARAEQLEPDNVPNLCVLTEKYCDLMYLAGPAASQENLLSQAMACARRAVEIDPKNSTAHASLAVCYAKACTFAGVKGKVTYSRMLENEAETAIRLNPREDVAYYLLGRWNYGVANIGLLSRTYVKLVYGGFPHASNEEAIKDFKKAIALAPGHAIYYTGLANVYEITEQRALTAATLKKCVELKPLDRDDQDAQQDALKKLDSMAQ
jgi:tetratricopeptide (TPR) repeat protein